MEIEKYEIDNGLNEDSATQIYTKDIAENEGYYTKYPVSVKSGNGDMYTIDFYQCTVDITGGSGRDDFNFYYDVDGDNDLYKIQFWDNNYYNYTYKLWYYDEDHPDPLLNAAYDIFRYETTDPHTYEDITLFTVEKADDNTVFLIECYSDIRSYGCSLANHGSTDRPWTSNIYVSNIWNHDIDVYDTNPSMAKSNMNVPYYHMP